MLQLLPADALAELEANSVKAAACHAAYAADAFRPHADARATVAKVVEVIRKRAIAGINSAERHRCTCRVHLARQAPQRSLRRLDARGTLEFTRGVQEPGRHSSQRTRRDPVVDLVEGALHANGAAH